MRQEASGKMVKKKKTNGKALVGEILPPGDDGNGPGQPEHEPTEENRRRVEVEAQRGTKHTGIAILIGISVPTLRKHYAAELVRGDAKVQSRLGQTLIEQAIGSPAEYYPAGHPSAGKLARAEVPVNIPALIFACKTRLGLREHIDVGLTEDLAEKMEFNTVGMTNKERLERIDVLMLAALARKKKKENG